MVDDGGYEASITYQLEVPQSDYYNIWVYIIRVGSSTPEASFYLKQGSSWTFLGGTEPDNGGHYGWGSITSSIQIPAGTQQIKVVNTKNASWCWLGIDAICFTTNGAYSPPEPTELTTNPYNSNFPWYSRPTDDMDTVEISVGSKTATFTADDTYSRHDLILVDDDGSGDWWKATTGVTHSGDTIGSGDDLSTATASPSISTNTKYVDSGAIINSSANFITTNCDGIDDEVTVGGSGSVDVKDWDDIGTTNKIKTLITTDTSGYTDGRTWDGRGNGYGSDSRYGPLLEGGFVLYTDGKYAPVRCDPIEDRQVLPRVLAISPNGDDTFDELEIYYDQASYSSSNTVELYKINSDLSETYICNQNDASITASNPIVWTGMNGASPRPGGYYRLKIKNSSGTLLAAPKIELLDKAGLPSGNWQPDFFPLGMWSFTETGYATAAMDCMASHNCNAVRTIGQDTTGILTSLNNASARGMKCFIDLYSWTHDHILLPDIAPCEPELQDMLEAEFGYASSGGIMGHAGLMGYYIEDEPGWDPSRDVERTYRWRGLIQTMREVDPNNPVTWCNIGLDSRLNFVTETEPHQLLIDVYPKSDGSSTGDFGECFNHGGWEMTWYIGEYQDLVEAYGGQTWVIAQAHRFGTQLDQPNDDEIRAQIWLNIAKGVKGLFFFIYESNPGEWEGLMHPDLSDQYDMLSQEYDKLDDHLDLLLGLEKTTSFNVSASGGGNRFQGGNAFIGRFENGYNKYFIAVNRNCESGYAGTYNDVTLNSTTFPGYEIVDVITDESYYFGDTITFELGEGKIFRIVETPPDPPTTPQNLQVTDTDVDSVSLEWQAPSGGGPVAVYKIYYGDNSYIDSTSNLTYTDSGLTSYTEYCYKVSAENAGGESVPTGQQCGITLADTDLDDDSFVGIYELDTLAYNWLQYVGADYGDFDRSGQVDIYDLSLLANDWTGNDIDAPTVPANLHFDDVTDTSIEIDWSASTDNYGVAGYYVYKNGDWSNYYDIAYSSDYIDVGLDPNSTYSYRLSAFDDVGNESDLCGEIQVTTLPDTTNYLNDPSIEMGIGGRNPWEGPFGEGDYGTGTWDTNPANARSGSASFKGTGEAGWGYGYVFQMLGVDPAGGTGYVKPSTSYRLKAHVNIPSSFSGNGVQIRAINYHGGGGTTNYSASRSTTTSGYETITLDFTTSADVSNMRIDLLWEIESADSAWFDDISISEQ
jgi:hypothetical protein